MGEVVNEESGPSVQSAGATSTNIHHVAVKPPIFYKKSPETWFRQMEAQFTLAGITKTTTKFCHVVSALPEEIACGVLTDDCETYEDIKAAVLTHLKANKHQLIEQALSTMDLGDMRPSQFVAEIKRRFRDIGLTADDAIIKSRLLSALPVSLKSALVGHDDSTLDQYVKIADSMLAVVASSSPFINVSAVQEQQQQHRGRDNYRVQGRHSGQGTSNRYAVKPFHPDQRPRICNSHIFFADRAKYCRPWCRWPGKKPQVLQHNQKTPTPSRSSSPLNT